MAIAFVGCDAHQRISKQVPTFANLFSAASEIQALVDQNGSVSDTEAYRILKKRNSGLDSWSNLILFRSKSDPEFTFLLVSLGRDNRLDVARIDDYFTHPQEDIVGDFDRDIVFRDGKPVTLASRK